MHQFWIAEHMCATAYMYDFFNWLGLSKKLFIQISEACAIFGK